MPKIFRVMREDAGYPAIGLKSDTLGARPDIDISADNSGNVHPSSGGMSVSPALSELPARLIPKRLRMLVPGAAGKDDNIVWSMGEGLFITSEVAPGLNLRIDPKTIVMGWLNQVM